MSSNANSTLINPQGSSRAFIEPDVKVPKRFGFHTFVVPMGKQGRLFKDGAFERDLPPGKHRWHSFLGNYTVSMVDARIRLLEMLGTGTIPGPVEEDRAPTPPAKVKVPLRISAQLANIETLLNTEEPLAILTAMITTFITTQIGQLRYDQYNLWIANLRAQLEHYLQYQAVSRTGLQVIEVFIQEPEGQTESDKRQLKLYQTATEIKNRAQLNAARNQQRVDDAKAAAEEGDLLAVKPFLVKLSETPEGVEIIKADLELRRMAIAAGMISASDGTILPRNPGQLPNATYTPEQSMGPGALGPGYTTNSYPSGGYSSGGYAAGGYTPGAAPASGGFGASSSYPPHRSQGSLDVFPGGSTPLSGQFQDVPSSPISGDAAPQDTDRFAVEAAQLSASGYIVHETDAVFEDAHGASVRGHEFTVIATDRTTVSVQMPPGFPQVAPVVWVKQPGSARSVPYRGAAVRDWTSASRLVDLVRVAVGMPQE